MYLFERLIDFIEVEINEDFDGSCYRIFGKGALENFMWKGLKTQY